MAEGTREMNLIHYDGYGHLVILGKCNGCGVKY